MPTVPDDELGEWQHIVDVRKTMLQWPTWTEVDPPVRGGGRRGDVHTAAAESIRIVVQLCETDGPGLEGARLRLVAWPFRREYDLTATLEVPEGGSFVTITRLDAWPADPHVNTRARSHPALRHLPHRIDSHHVHRFADNAKLGRKAFQDNLPVAVPVESELRSFRDFARIIGQEFNIEGTDQIEPPPDWHGLLV